jgi:hypothetical protein
MLIARSCIDPFGSCGTRVRFVTVLLYRRCPDKGEKSREYRITIKRKGARNLRRYGGAIFGRPLFALGTGYGMLEIPISTRTGRGRAKTDGS